jgi:hypothetical protein
MEEVEDADDIDFRVFENVHECYTFECQRGWSDLVEVGNVIAAVEVIVDINLKLKVERERLESSGKKMA